jgi:hypothetical protein
MWHDGELQIAFQDGRKCRFGCLALEWRVAAEAGMSLIAHACM